MALHKTFCAFGAYAVNVIDPNATVVMPLANAGALGKPIDPTKLVTLNLNKRLKTDVAGPGADWDEAILDTTGVNEHGVETGPLPFYSGSSLDLATGKLTYRGVRILTIGPVFPGGGNNIGGIYVERGKFYAEIRPLIGPGKAAWPDALVDHTYQVMSSARLEGGNITRYHGFHATVVESDGDNKQLSVTLPFGGPRLVNVNMKNRDACDDPAILALDVQDPSRPAVTELVLNEKSAKNDQGAIFLSLKTCTLNTLFPHKEPLGGGG
jgi:hypothetical protein